MAARRVIVAAVGAKYETRLHFEWCWRTQLTIRLYALLHAVTWRKIRRRHGRAGRAEIYQFYQSLAYNDEHFVASVRVAAAAAAWLADFFGRHLNCLWPYPTTHSRSSAICRQTANRDGGWFASALSRGGK